ncbi:MAG: hybrid sensor histidine kinase/response regulator [Anaerolineae bacterium]|jgi:chemotaxis protein histidine kinase CheA
MKFDRSLFIGKFSVEAEEHLQNLNEGVLRLERGEADPELMAEILRAAHTLKGSARMMGFKEINQVAHRLEDLLLEVKEERIETNPLLCDLLFRALDTMDAMRQAIVEGREGEVEGQTIVDLLEQAAQGEPFELPPRQVAAPPDEAPEEPAARAPESADKVPDEPVKEVPPEPAEKAPAPPKPPVVTEERVRVNSAKLDKTIRLSGEVIAAQKRAEMRQGDLRRAWLMAKDHSQLLRGSLGEDHDPESAAILDSGQALRDYLDRLVKQNREDVADLSRVVAELQQDTLGLRMLPVSTVFDTFPRAVRDLARERGKEIDLVVKGGETELDKHMLERIGDPLMHMLRNAIDHGIEPPEEREAGGKPRRGIVELRAFPLGSSIIIEVRDDGRGISSEAIRQKALSLGVADHEKLLAMSDRELQSYIFLSGFSTSQTVTDISGRGVGLDVVRRNIIEELKGDISVDTGAGQGTRFTLTLPLTLTTLRILFVRLGHHLFGLPITYVAETTRVRPEEVIDVVDREAIRHGPQIVPIASLAEILNLPGHDAASSKAATESTPAGDGWIYLVLAKVAEERLGFVVDEVADEDDVLIKPLPRHMKPIGILSGATISPGGRVIPILHVPGLIRAVRTFGPTRRAPEVAQVEDAPRILVIDDSLNTREIEKSILEAEGYQVDVARDGLDALRVIDQAPVARGQAYYDLLIVDIEMPRLDGLSLTEQLRQDERYAQVPIVIVSSRDKDEDRQRGLDVGANAYIVKGTFEQGDLTTTVASLLGRAAPGNGK